MSAGGRGGRDGRRSKGPFTPDFSQGLQFLVSLGRARFQPLRMELIHFAAMLSVRFVPGGSN